MEGTVIEEVEWTPLSGGKGRESLNKELKWKPFYDGAEGDGSLIEEVKRRPLSGGAQGGEV